MAGQHSPNPDGIKDLSATPQDLAAPAKDLSTLSPTGQLLLFSVEPTIRSKPPSASRRSSPPDQCSSENLALDEIDMQLNRRPLRKTRAHKDVWQTIAGICLKTDCDLSYVMQRRQRSDTLGKQGTDCGLVLPTRVGTSRTPHLPQKKIATPLRPKPSSKRRWTTLRPSTPRPPPNPTNGSLTLPSSLHSQDVYRPAINTFIEARKLKIDELNASHGLGPGHNRATTRRGTETPVASTSGPASDISRTRVRQMSK